MKQPISLVECCDNMEFMSRYPDKFFDLAIVDPPYGIGISTNPVRQKHTRKNWDNCIPLEAYFKELDRVSKNYIIWGGNYFINFLSNTQGFIIWDKKQPEDFSLAMAEFAYSTFQSPAKIFRYSVLTERDKIHPTQKPVKLYKWILSRYANKGDIIFDSHLGSQSSRVAAYDLGFDFYGCEIDPDYFKSGCDRFDKETQTVNLFHLLS